MVVAVKSKGTGFRGLAQYLEKGSARNPKPDRIEWIEARNLTTPDPLTAARIMRATANHNDRVAGAAAKPVEHLSISWEPGDRPTKEQMIEVADRVLQAAGLSPNQALIVAHNDTRHAHVHLFINRVDPETFRVASDKHDYWPIEEVLRRAEREFGWRETPGHHFRFPDQQRPHPDRNHSKVDRRQIEEGKHPFVDLVRAVAREEFKVAQTWADLERRLADKGLRLEPVGKVGFIVTDGQERCKASEIDRGAGRGALEKRLGSYEQRHDRTPERAPQQDRGVEQGRSGESRRPDAGDHSRDAGHHEPGRPRPDRAEPDHGRDRAPDADQRDQAHGGDRRPGPDRGDAGRGSERLRDEVPAWWRDHQRPEQPASLNAAFERLEKFDRISARLKNAEAELAQREKELKQATGKEAWGEKVKAEAIRELGKVYRDPEAAFERIKAEINRTGAGRTTAKLEGQPEAFGKMHGWRVAGGILTKQPFTLFASGARREAKNHVADIGREMRGWASIDKAVKAALAGKGELTRLRDQARTTAEQLRAERGTSHRWEHVREVERAAKAATPKERAALSPERQRTLEKIQAEQRTRFEKVNQERGRQQNQIKEQQQTRAPSRAPTRGRDGPDFER